MLPLSKAREVVPTLAKVVPRPDSATCSYLDEAGLPHLALSEARQPRSEYEDEQYSARGADEGLILVSAPGGEWPRSVWVATQSGPVTLHHQRLAGGDGAVNPHNVDELIALARIIRA